MTWRLELLDAKGNVISAASEVWLRSVNMTADKARKLPQAGYELGPRDMDQAIELAKFLLAGNENCCFAPRFR